MNNCPNCGSKVNSGEAFCRECGAKMLVPQTNFSNNTQQSQLVDNDSTGFQQSQNNEFADGMQQDNYINNEDLIDAYIGKKANIMKKDSISVNVFFFGFLYVFYRKMWLLGFIWLAVDMVASMFLSSLAGGILLVTDIVITIQFKKWYLKHVEEQVDKIKSENPGKTKEQLMMICRKKGGTTLVPVIITIIIFGIIIMLFISQLNKFNKSREKSEDYHNNSSTTITNGKDTIGDLDVTIPSNLVASSYSTDTIKMYRTNYNDNDACALKIITTKLEYYNDDAKRYLEENLYYSSTDTFSGISPKSLNGNTWYYATLTTSYDQEYYYSISYNGTIYEVVFVISNDDNKTCSAAYNTVMNSLRFK